MDFKQLRSFVAVADCGSFTRAAEKLYTSQPTVSAHIRALEEELHEQLFLRTTKSLEITRRGQELYQYAVHVLSLGERLTASWTQDEKTIRIGASTIPSACILPEILPSYRDEHGDLRFIIHQSDSRGVLTGLLEGQFNVGLVGMKTGDEHLVFTPFYDDELVLITAATDRFRTHKGLPGAVSYILRHEPVLMREHGSGSQAVTDTLLAECDIAPEELNIMAQLNDLASTKNLVAGGLGVAILSRKAAEEDCRSGKLLSFPFESPGARRKLYLVRRKDAFLSETEEDFLQFAQNFYRNEKPTSPMEKLPKPLL
ncbi:MAG: LysR family transcriptional regulator [Oscillospiraceae bacterium]|nr:LysR family transcriptional regulator [Oscillospiraceae bacterium]